MTDETRSAEAVEAERQSVADLRNALHRAGYALFQIKRIVPEAIHAFASAEHLAVCDVLDAELVAPRETAGAEPAVWQVGGGIGWFGMTHGSEESAREFMAEANRDLAPLTATMIRPLYAAPLPSPDSRDAVIEECAQLFELLAQDGHSLRHIAKNIRALKSSEAKP